MATQAPKSVEEIVTEAQDFDHKSDYPLRIALRTAQNILNQVPRPIDSFKRGLTCLGRQL